MTNVTPFLTGANRERFLALQALLVPRSQTLSTEEREAGLVLVNTLVGRMPQANQKKLRMFLLLIDLMSYIFMLRPFRKLPVVVQLRLLWFLFDGPVPLLRKGFWGLNSLAKLSVYGQPSIYPQIGYQLRENPQGTAA